MDWRTRRQVTILVILFLVFGGAIFGGLGYYLYEPPTCTDGKKNQNEDQVDCGGECVSCQFRVRRPIQVFSSSVVQPRAKTFDIVVEIQNPNDHLAANPLAYRVRLYDDKGAEIGVRDNITFIYPGDRIHIIEIGFRTERAAIRAEFSILETATVWQYTEELKPKVTIGNKSFESVTEGARRSSKIKGEIENGSAFGFREIPIRALLLDGSGNIIGVAKTLLQNVASGERRRFEMPSPQDFGETTPKLEVETRANALDRGQFFFHDSPLQEVLACYGESRG